MVRSESISASAAHDGVSGCVPLRSPRRPCPSSSRCSVLASSTGGSDAEGLEVQVHFQPPGARQYPNWQPAAHRVDTWSSAVRLEHALAPPAASSAAGAAAAEPSAAGAVAAAPQESQVSMLVLGWWAAFLSRPAPEDTNEHSTALQSPHNTRAAVQGRVWQQNGHPLRRAIGDPNGRDPAICGLRRCPGHSVQSLGPRTNYSLASIIDPKRCFDCPIDPAPAEQ